jgi:opacity protein-like surface antigen
MLSIRAPRVLRFCLVAIGLAAGAPTSAVAQNSEGTYQVRVGAFLDLGGTRLSETNPLDAGGTANTGKFGVGGSAGFEMLRSGAWTLGVEGDLGVTGGGAPNINGVRFGADYFASLRGRAGFYLRPDWVVYGTGGAAFRGVSVDAGVAGAAGKVEKTLTGGIFGGGMEWHHGGTILFAEYLHTSLAGAEFAVNGNTFSVKGQSDTFRLGVKFKLGYDGYYDYVRDDRRK